jgi:hypothetical protein
MWPARPWWWRRHAGLAGFARLPARSRWFLVALLSCAAIPAVAGLVAAQGGSVLSGQLAAHPEAVQVGAALLAVLVVVAFEPPRSTSPLAYVRQLRARFLELQSAFDADGRRHPGEGKEKADDHVPSKP